MIDTFKKIKGYIKVEAFDAQGVVVDTFENHNLIMDTAGISMAELIAGVSSANDFDKFVIGTDGHIADDLTNLRTVTSDMTELFSETSGKYFYPVEFTNPGSSGGGCAVADPAGSEGVTVTLSQSAGNVTYVITLPEGAANDIDNEGVSPFTEAALYVGTNIFSMKTFNGKVKDITVSLKITWTISF